MQPRDAVLLAGGPGTRLRHVEVGPKPLVSVVAGVTVIDLVVSQLISMGARRFWIAGGHHNTIICDYLAARLGAHAVRALPEEKPGTASVLAENLGNIPPRVILANADTIYLSEYHECRTSSTNRISCNTHMGVGFSAFGGPGNVLLSETSVYRYDKGGVGSLASDAGYHVININKLKKIIRRSKGMLEDGLLQQFVLDGARLWHNPVQYLDLGTEHAIAKARECLAEFSHDPMSVRPRSMAIATQALYTLRERFRAMRKLPSPAS